MAFLESTPPPLEKPKIDLQGPDGNAFVLLGYAHRFAKQLGYDKDDVKRICDEMREKDYQHLIKVFDRYFGEHVDLILPANWVWQDNEYDKEEDPMEESIKTTEPLNIVVTVPHESLSLKPKFK